jgi:hypothetical protein
MNTNNNTPLNMDKLKKNAATVESPGRDSFPKLFDKYNIILGLSILALIAGASFWIFVTYML